MSKALLALLVLPALLGCRAEAGPPLRAAFPGRDPALRWDGTGNLHVVSVEDREGGAVLSYRRFGTSPAGPVTVSPPGLAVKAHGEAAPVLEVLPDGSLVTAYPVALPGKWKGEIRVQRSTDRGATWSEARRLHPQRDGSHSYLSSAVTSQGKLAFAWLDNRTGHMGLQFTTSPDGVTFPPSQTLDPATCECCGTELLAGRKGELWLAYRALEKGDVRDILLLKAGAAGKPAPAGRLSADGWSLDGCPHTGARLDQAADGTLWAAWYTGADPGVYAASSKDGTSFTRRTLVARATDPVRAVRHPELGVLPDGRVAVLYETVRADGTQPLLVRLREPGTGSWGPPATVAPQGAYPRLAVSGRRAALGFTCRTGKGTNVVVADWSLAGKGALGETGCSSTVGEASGHHH